MDSEAVYLQIHLEELTGKGLDVAELGVFLTAINRWVNRASVKSKELALPYSPVAHEPRFVRLNITEVRNGSVTIDALMNFFGSQVATDAFLASLAASAAYDGLKILTDCISRAFGRLNSPESPAMSFRISFKIKDKRRIHLEIPVGCTVLIHEDGRIEVARI
ncbi:hypothetical protein [Massilia glaciei]|uniref:Uncharacterized protein n=1 Tax=Massilia glaciei TaxID=1524097 RepID=A0A2U2HA69_9BURK|nr:hypothetical protein [Massilia glaciei]PWF39567.1 hypothetical protein C7C56_026785 [Massilia glaciei]